MDLLEATFQPEVWSDILDKGADKTIPLAVLKQWCHAQTRADLLLHIIEGSYFIKPPTVVKIPKDNGRFREIYVNTADDRVILAAINQALYNLFEDKLSPACKAYRKGHSCAKTVREVAAQQLKGYKLDLSRYFDSVSHEVINNALAELDTGSPLEEVLYEYYNDDIAYVDGSLTPRFKSLAQGCAVASFLANYILRNADKEMLSRCNYYCRYSDDMLILCETQKQADEALAVLKQMLSDLGLSLNPEKIESVSKDKEFKFLGFGIRGSNITISQKDFSEKKSEVKQACQTVRRDLPFDKKLRAAVKATQKVFFSKLEPTHGWLYTKALGINDYDRLSELNSYCKDCIRATVTGTWNYTHNIHKITNERLALAGYTSLVHMAKLARYDKTLYATEHLLKIKQG